MKAIVVIDEFPKSCCECPLAHSEAGFFGDICDSVCTVLDRTNIVFMDGIGKPDWCPLKPLPEKKDIDIEVNLVDGDGYEDGYRDGYSRGVDAGWNKCLGEIDFK